MKIYGMVAHKPGIIQPKVNVTRGRVKIIFLQITAFTVVIETHTHSILTAIFQLNLV